MICNVLIDGHQYAHLPKQDIHAAITKNEAICHRAVKKEMLCVLDLTKALDCVERLHA